MVTARRITLELFDARTGSKIRSLLRAVLALIFLAWAIARPSMQSTLAVLSPAVALVVECVVQLFVADSPSSPYVADERENA